jgi:hypothetical protein
MLRTLPEAARRRLVDTCGAPQFSSQTLRPPAARTVVAACDRSM